MLTVLRYDMGVMASSHCFFATGRSCLVHLIERYGVERVLMPVMVPDGLIVPFEKANARIDHYRLNADLSPDLDDMEKVLGRVKFWAGRPGPVRQLVVVIHYFGYAMPTVDASIITHAHGGLLLEDSAHCLVNPNPKNDCADLVLFSMNKILPVADGAMLVSRAPDVDVSAKPPEGLDRATLNAYENHMNANRRIRAVGSGDNFQLAQYQSAKHYEEYYKGISADMTPRHPSRLAMGIREAIDFDLVVTERKKNAAVIVNQLRARQLFREGLPIFALPVRCRGDRGYVRAQLEVVGIAPAILNAHWRAPPPCYVHEVGFWEEHLLLPINNGMSPAELNHVARMARKYV